MVTNHSTIARTSRLQRRQVGAARLGWLWLGLVLLLGFAAGGLWYGQPLTEPHPERFASGVQTSGPAWEAAQREPAIRAYLDGFRTQEHWSSCGPASLRNVLGSLGRPVARERDLFDDDTGGWLRMWLTGMTLDEVAALAKEADIGRIRVWRDFSESQFRDLLASLDSPERRLIANFDRAPLHGVSLGHFSPIAGYDPTSNRVVLLDVTPGFGIQLVPVSQLYAAINTTDPVTGRARGLIVIDTDLASDAVAPTR
jgi:hypothetical protein